MTTALYQNDRRWASLILGHGPSHIGGAGCVLVSLTMAARELGSRPDLIPPHANTACVIAGAFAGDELIVPKAALALGLFADHEPTLGLPSDLGLVTALETALAGGMALVRVDVSFDGKGDHTILATKRLDDGRIECLCPAIGPVTLSADLRATADWGHHEGEGAARKWVPNLKTYRVVGVRGVRRPAA